MGVYTNLKHNQTSKKTLLEQIERFIVKHEKLLTFISALLLFCLMFLSSVAFGNPVNE